MFDCKIGLALFLQLILLLYLFDYSFFVCLFISYAIYENKLATY